MSDIPSAVERAALLPCLGFVWVGQSFASCDACGHPYWEHAYDIITYRTREGRLRRKRRVITTAKAEQVRQAHVEGKTVPTGKFAPWRSKRP